MRQLGIGVVSIALSLLSLAARPLEKAQSSPRSSPSAIQTLDCAGALESHQKSGAAILPFWHCFTVALPFRHCHTGTVSPCFTVFHRAVAEFHQSHLRLARHVLQRSEAEQHPRVCRVVCGASTVSDNAAVSRVVVLIAGEGQESVARDLAQAIHVQLLDLNIRLKIRRWPRFNPASPADIGIATQVAREEGAVIVFWGDFAAPGKMHLYFFEPGAGRLVAREVNRMTDGADGYFEAVGAILRSFVDATEWRDPGTDGRPSGRQNAPALAVDSAGAAPEPTVAAVGLGYLARVISSQTKINSGGAISFSLSFGRHWSAQVGYGVIPGVEVTDSDTRLRLNRHDFRLGGGFSWRFEGFSLGGQASFLLGLFDRHTSALSDAMHARPDESRTTLGIETALRVGLAVRPRIHLYSALGATLELWNIGYDVVIDGRRSPLFQPWTVQPFGLIELALELN